MDADIACQMGAQVGETGFLSAAGRQLATRCEFITWLEGSYGALLLKRDVARPRTTI